MGEAAPILDDATPLVLLESEAEVAALPTADAPPRTQVPASLLARLIAYAQTRLAAGVGVNLLHTAGLAAPGFVEMCAPGVMPSTYRQALAPVDAALLAGIDLADTLLLPLSSYAFISTKRLDETMSMTVLEYVTKANIYTMQTNKPLRIRARRELETAGTSGHKRFITYKRDPEVLKLHLPMPLQFLAPQQVLMTFIVPGMFRLGGLDIRRPGAFRYRDYI